MSAPPAITVHSLDHARAAMRVAQELGQEIILLSPPGATAYVGPAWFKEVVAAARQDEPDAEVRALLDCGDRPGDVLAAFRIGVSGVIFSGRDDVAGKLAALAEAHGTTFRTTRPQAVDLLDRDDPDAVLRSYLAASDPTR